MEPEVQFERLLEVIEQIADVPLEPVIVEGLGLHVLQGAVLRRQAGADLVVPPLHDLVRRPFCERLGGLLVARPERRVHPRNGPQHGSGWRLARWLVGADQWSQTGVHEPVDETLLQTLGGHADLGEHFRETSPAALANQ